MKQAVSSPLLETTIEGASHVIINISGDISLIEANEAASYVQEMAGDDANIIFGAMWTTRQLRDEASITVIATGLDMGSETPVGKVMTSFGGSASGYTRPQKPAAQPAQEPESNPNQEAAATAPAYNRIITRITAPNYGNQGYNPNYNKPNYGGQGRCTRCSQGAGQPYRPTVNREVQINIPDFLKNKR